MIIVNDIYRIELRWAVDIGLSAAATTTQSICLWGCRLSHAREKACVRHGSGEGSQRISRMSSSLLHLFWPKKAGVHKIKIYWRKWNTTEKGRGQARTGWCLARNQRFGGDWPPPASCRLAKQIRIQKPRPSFTLQPNIYHTSLSLLSCPFSFDFGCDCRGWQKKRPDASHDREAPYSSSGPRDAPLLPSETLTDTSTPPQTESQPERSSGVYREIKGLG